MQLWAAVKGLAGRTRGAARDGTQNGAAPVRQCARGGLKRAPTRAGAACESEQAQRGRKAACRLASHRRGRAPARLPRQREARGARQRVALCLGIAAAGPPTSLLRPIHHGLAERRAARLVPRHFGLGEWFRDLSQASGASQRVQRASVACSSNGACGGWPCTPRSFVWPQPGGRASSAQLSCDRCPFHEGCPLCNWVAPWRVLNPSLTLCAARDQRVPAGKSGRSLRLGAPSLLLIEGAARCRRRARLTYTVWRVCDPNPIYHCARTCCSPARRRGSPRFGCPSPREAAEVGAARARSVGGAAGSSFGSGRALCASRAGLGARQATWLILPVVICLSQRLSHACLSISDLYCETANGSLNQLWFI